MATGQMGCAAGGGGRRGMYSGRGVRDDEPSQSIKPILMKRPSLLLLGLDAEKGADPCMVAADCSHHAPRAPWEVMLETVIMSGGASQVGLPWRCQPSPTLHPPPGLPVAPKGNNLPGRSRLSDEIR